MSDLKSNRVLSIDQSLNSTGWCLWHNGELIDFGVISQSPETPQYIRVYSLTLELDKIAKENMVDKIVIEGLSYGSISTSVRVLGAIYFQIQILAHTNNIKFEEHSPNSVKKFATGLGKAPKKAMWEALPAEVQRKILVRFKTIKSGRHDICDAYWIYKVSESVNKGNIK